MKTLPTSIVSRLLVHTLVICSVGTYVDAQEEEVKDCAAQYECNQNETQDNPPKEEGEPTQGDPVMLSRGRLLTQATDLSIKGRGIDLEFSRTYINGNSVLNALSPGWDLNWFKRIVVEYEPFSSNPPLPCFGLNALVRGVYYFDGACRIEQLTFDTQNPGFLKPPDGYFAKVTYDDAGHPGFTPERFYMRFSDGTIFTFEDGSNSSPYVGGCTITFWLTKVEDRMGNEINLYYDDDPSFTYRRLTMMTDTYDREVYFEYEHNEHLTAIEDFYGRRVEYEYDSSNRLVGVRSPAVAGTSTGNDFPSGKETRYVYGPTGGFLRHNILEMIHPQEILDDPANPTPYLTIQYDSSGRRVLSQQVGGTNSSGIPAGGTYKFIYDTPFNPINHGWFTEVGKTLVITPNGNVGLWVFEASGNERIQYEFTGRLDPENSSSAFDQISELLDLDLSTPQSAKDPTLNRIKPGLPSSIYTPPLRITDRASYYSLKTLNSRGQVIEREEPRLHEIITYDENSTDEFQRGNRLRIERRPMPFDSSTPIVETFAYEPFFNRLRGDIGPRSNDGSYVPPNGGTSNLGRYLTSTVFDYQEVDTSTGTMNDLANAWNIDLVQDSQYAELAGLETYLPKIPDADELLDINGDGVGTTLSGNIVLRNSPSAQIFDISDLPGMVGPSPTFVPQTIESQFTYNTFSLPTSYKDPEGNVTSMTYYPAGNPTGQSTTSHASSFGGFPAEVVDAEMIANLYQYDPLGRSISITDGRSNPTLFEYNDLDQTVAITDSLGYVRSFLYDGNDNIIEKRITNETPEIDTATGLPSGATLNNGDIANFFTYDVLNQMVESDIQAGSPSSPSERIIKKYRYDKEENQVLIFFPESDTDPSDVISLVYDERNLLRSRTRGGVTQEFKDLLANENILPDPLVVAIPDLPPAPGDLVTVLCDYDEGGNKSVEIDGEGNPRTTAYDSFNRIVRETDPLGNYLETDWDVANNLTAERAYEYVDGIEDLLLEETLYSHDEQRRTYQIDRALFCNDPSIPVSEGTLTPNDGYVSERTIFDKKGRTVLSMDDNQSYSGGLYDGRDRLVEHWDNSVLTLGADPWTEAATFRISTVFDPADSVLQSRVTEYREDGTTEIYDTWFCYDEINRRTALIDSLGNTQRFLYDSRGNLVFSSDPKTVDLDSSYIDALDSQDDHLALSTPPPHLSPNFTAINNHGNTQWIEYDDANRQIAVNHFLRVGGSGEGALDMASDPDGIVRTELSYDRDTRLTQRKDESQNPTIYEYDSLGRMKRTIAADGTAVEILDFDRNHLIAQQRDANGSIETNTYDAASRLTSRTIQRGQGVVGTTLETYEYDGLDRMTLAADNDSTVELTHDSLSRLCKEVQNGETVATAFDGVGNMTQCLYPFGGLLNKIYDPYNRLDSIVDSGSGAPLAAFDYIGPRRVEKREIFKLVGQFKMTQTIGYDAIQRVTSTHHQTAVGGTIDHRTYEWDRASNKTRRKDEASGVRHDYTYDSLNRLHTSTRSASPRNRTVDYSLDGVGNRTDVSGGAFAGDYTQNANDAPVNQYSRVPTDLWTHDNNGNTTKKRRVSSNGKAVFIGGGIGGGGSATYSEILKYDYRNQLVQYRDNLNGVVFNYRYDALGRRIAKESDGTETRFYYVGTEVCEERDENGTTLAVYVHGLSIDQPIMAVRGPDLYFYHTDDLGNVMKLTDLNGGIIHTYDYDDFGRPVDGVTFSPLDPSVLSVNPYLFSGRRYDAESDLFYYRSRYLDPRVGRFITRDPIGVWGDAVNLGNGYTYVANNPWTYRDPMGLETGTGHAGCPGVPEAPGAFDWFWDEFNRDPATANRNPNETGGKQKKWKAKQEQKRKEIDQRKQEREKQSKIDKLRDRIKKLEKKMQRQIERYGKDRGRFRNQGRGYGRRLRELKRELGSAMADSFEEHTSKNGLTSDSISDWKSGNNVSDSEWSHTKNQLRYRSGQRQEQLAKEGRRHQRWATFWSGTATGLSFLSGLGGHIADWGSQALGSNGAQIAREHAPRTYAVGRIGGLVTNAVTVGKAVKVIAPSGGSAGGAAAGK